MPSSALDPSPASAIRRTVAAPLAVLIGHAVFGKILGHEPLVDPVSHFAGGMAAAYVMWAVFRVATRLGTPSDSAVDLMAVGGTSLVALAWELGELASDLIVGSTTQTSPANTLRDLGLGVLGAGVVIVLRRNKTHVQRYKGPATMTLSAGLLAAIAVTYQSQSPSLALINCLPTWSWAVGGIAVVTTGVCLQRLGPPALIATAWLAWAIVTDGTLTVTRSAPAPIPDQVALRVVTANCAQGSLEVVREALALRPRHRSTAGVSIQPKAALHP